VGVSDEGPDLHVEVVLVDGSGEWHMRVFELACCVDIEAQDHRIPATVFKQRYKRNVKILNVPKEFLE
jgi:hypothetical protein